LTAGGTTEPRPSARKRRDYKIVGEVMQINADDSDGAYDDDEMSDVGNGEEVNKKMGRKDEVKWAFCLIESRTGDHKSFLCTISS